MSVDFEEWRVAAEEICEEILGSTGYRAGVVDTLQLARELKYTIVVDRCQPSRGRLKQIAGRTTIFLRPDERPERIHWAISHEIGETLAHRVFQRVGADPRDHPGLREQVANLLGSCLLLPGFDFFPQARACEEDLLELKKHYWTASHELIALRLLDQPEWRCVTVIDQGRITKRRSTWQSSAGPLLPSEEICWRDSHQGSKYSEQSASGLNIRSWPIHEPHWKREIILTRANSDASA